MSAALKTKLLSKVSIDAVTGCWNWTGIKSASGYGEMAGGTKEMGDEADADWQAGLGEWGDEDTRRWLAEKMDKALKRSQVRARRIKRASPVTSAQGTEK